MTTESKFRYVSYLAGLTIGVLLGYQLCFVTATRRWRDLAQSWENMDKITSDALLISKQALAWCQDPTRGNLKSGNTAHGAVIHADWNGKSFVCPAGTDLWASEPEALERKPDYVYCVPIPAKNPHSRE